MQKKLFVGSLPYNMKEEEIQEMFQQAGEVVSANIIRDRMTNQSRGFGFVEMATEEQAAEAIKRFNGMSVGGRNIVVNESRPQEKRGFDKGKEHGGEGRKRQRY